MIEALVIMLVVVTGIISTLQEQETLEEEIYKRGLALAKDLARFSASRFSAMIWHAEASARYGAVALRHVTQRGGRLALMNAVEQTIIGPEEGWHQVAIMQHPSTAAFVDMLRDPDYAAALVHRDAGLARTVVLVTRPLLPSGA